MKKCIYHSDQIGFYQKDKFFEFIEKLSNKREVEILLKSASINNKELICYFEFCNVTLYYKCDIPVNSPVDNKLEVLEEQVKIDLYGHEFDVKRLEKFIKSQVKLVK